MSEIDWEARATAAEAERDTLATKLADETKRADENYDDVHKWRAKARELAAKLDAVKALCEKESGEIRTRYEPEGPYTGYANACDDVLAILADTDEGKAEHANHKFCDPRLGCVMADTDETGEKP